MPQESFKGNDLAGREITPEIEIAPKSCCVQFRGAFFHFKGSKMLPFFLLPDATTFKQKNVFSPGETS